MIPPEPGRRKTLLLNAQKIVWEGSADMIPLVMEDITERKGQRGFTA